VIPAGRNNIIFARHTILALQDLLHVTLPIAIAFVRDEDLPPDNQQSLLGLRPGVKILDVMAVLSDEFIHLRNGAWAVKPFAVLASRFEQVILIDADIVFVQPPETLLDHPGYQETSTLFFHERQLEREPGNKRQAFLKAQTANVELLYNCCKKILRGHYRDEQDSGVVLIDKRKLPVLIRLLHTCWQNPFPVQDDVTYKIFYSDKESYWIGMALTKAPYVFKSNWAGIAGELHEWDGKKQVCRNTISHSSEKDKSLI
jgi:alpha 1,3-mannosyltransferase